MQVLLARRERATGPQTKRSPAQNTILLTCQSADMLCSGVTMTSECNFSHDFAWPMSVHFDVPLPWSVCRFVIGHPCPTEFVFLLCRIWYSLV